MFDDTLLSDYILRFYGYGNSGGDLWFVGMEEGGGQSFEEVQMRLNIWDRRGRKSLEDLRDYHNAIGITQWFDEKARLQKTWSKLIYILLSTQGQTAQSEDIRLYQRTKLGRQQADHCLIELLPLPNPSTNPADWWYQHYSSLVYLATRETYQNEFLSKRAANLYRRVQQHQPKTVVFYGKAYQQWWQQIANVDFSTDDPAIGSDGKTVFVITQHPAAHGVTNEYFQQVGQKIRTLITNSP
jgi:hypothetical protein